MLFDTIKNGIKLKFDSPVSNFNLVIFGKFGMICSTKELTRRVFKMSRKFKKIKKIEKPQKRNNNLSYSEFKTLVEGFSDDEISRFCDLLSNLQRKP